MYFDKKWFQGRWLNEQESNSMQRKELYPIVVAAATWGHLWSRRRITFMCDNEAITHAIATGTSKFSSIMCLLRMLFFRAAKHNFSTTAKYIPGKTNKSASKLTVYHSSQHSILQWSDRS